MHISRLNISRSFWMTLVLAALLVLAAPQVSPAAIVFSINIAPPLLPVYGQPACPGPGYTWVDGYYGPTGIWVAGYWAAPAVVHVAPRIARERFVAPRFEHFRR